MSYDYKSTPLLWKTLNLLKMHPDSPLSFLTCSAIYSENKHIISVCWVTALDRIPIIAIQIKFTHPWKPWPWSFHRMVSRGCLAQTMRSCPVRTQAWMLSVVRRVSQRESQQSSLWIPTQVRTPLQLVQEPAHLHNCRGTGRILTF